MLKPTLEKASANRCW